MLPSREASRERQATALPAGGISVAVDEGFAFTSAAYRDLYARAPSTAFQHPAWLTALAARIAPARGARPATIVVRDQGGTLLAVLPLMRRRKSGVTLLENADLGVSDYAAPVVDPAFASELAARPDLRRQVAEALPSYDILRIRPVREEHLTIWQALLPGRVECLDFSAHATALDPEYAAWRAAKPSKTLLGRLARAEKQMVKLGGGVVRRLDQPQEIRAAVDAIQALRAGRFEGDPIQDDFIRDFYAAVAIDGAAEGFAAVYRLDIGGATAGTVFGLCHGGAYHYLLIGCDYANFGRCSPGLILYDRIIRDWIGRGGTVFDFTIGDEPFKADFGTEPTRMFAVVHAPGWRGRLALAAFEARAQLRLRLASNKTTEPQAAS
jgi:CelD/BcsL family acetyltransferase involved in cellulose biosynthesis